MATTAAAAPAAQVSASRWADALAASGEHIKSAAAAVLAADTFVFTTGAGMGVDSGLPDFRGPTGFWAAYPPMKHLGLRFEDMSTPHWFADDPEFAWGFFGHRAALYGSAQPHAGYAILGAWARRAGRAFSFTSNVDGHWLRSGFASDAVLECHGSLAWSQCAAPDDCEPAGRDAVWSADPLAFTVDPASFRAVGTLPTCRYCGRLARPNVLMFSDGDWVGVRADGQEGRFNAFVRGANAHARAVAIIEIGAGTAVPTVRQTSEMLAAQFGERATLIRINPAEPTIDTLGDGRARGIELPLPGLLALEAISAAMAASQS